MVVYEHYLAGPMSLLEMDTAYDEAAQRIRVLSAFRMTEKNLLALSDILQPQLRKRDGATWDEMFRIVTTYNDLAVYADSSVPENCIFVE